MNALMENVISNKKVKEDEKEAQNLKFHDQIFEGTLTAVGWDSSDIVNQMSLYTQDDEDILLEHNLGIEKLKPYLTEKVRIFGDITRIDDNGKWVLVNDIVPLWHGFTPNEEIYKDEFNNIIEPA